MSAEKIYTAKVVNVEGMLKELKACRFSNETVSELVYNLTTADSDEIVRLYNIYVVPNYKKP